MEKLKIREKYRDLINDINFDKLELGLQTPNIFNILGVSRTEIRHSNFLGWLLDPNENHGLGKQFLIKFLRSIFISEIAKDIDEFDIKNLNFHNVEVRREWKHIDLLLVFDSVVICIENKVDSKDHSNQLKKYRKVVSQQFPHKNKVFVYLTPSGEEPLSKSEIDHYVLYSYQEIIEDLDRIIEIHGKSLSDSVSHYISDYITTLKRELMKNDELNELADKIYQNHRELIDFIIENKSDTASYLLPVFEKKIKESGWLLGSKNKGYARFLTPKLNEIIPRKGKGWNQKESFLFEIDFFWTKGRAVFKTVISPSDSKAQEILKLALENTEGFQKPRGSQWLVHFIHVWNFNAEELLGEKESVILELIDKGWNEIEEIVKKVEIEILKYESDLINLSNET